jgi:hypothetical protein
MSLLNNTENETSLTFLEADLQPISNETSLELKNENAISILGTNANSMFLVIMGSIIIFMQAGFGFLEAGSIRAKNTTNILIKNFADLTFGTLHIIETYV